jgi:hypothetical protein
MIQKKKEVIELVDENDFDDSVDFPDRDAKPDEDDDNFDYPHAEKPQQKEESIASYLTRIHKDYVGHVIEHEQRNIDENPDSISIGTDAKGGSIKCYGNANDLDAFKKKLDNMFLLREIARQTFEMQQNKVFAPVNKGDD